MENVFSNPRRKKVEHRAQCEAGNEGDSQRLCNGALNPAMVLTKVRRCKAYHTRIESERCEHRSNLRDGPSDGVEPERGRSEYVGQNHVAHKSNAPANQLPAKRNACACGHALNVFDSFGSSMIRHNHRNENGSSIDRLLCG